MTTQASRAGVAKLWLLNFLGNAGVLAAWYFWLLVPDAHGWQVAFSLLAAVCIIVLVVWLRAGTFAYFRLAEFRDNGAVWRAFRHSLRHLVALALWAVVLAVVLWFLFWLRTYPPQFGVWLWQKLPESLRFASPRQLTQYATACCCCMLGAVANGLPIATTIAACRLREACLQLSGPADPKASPVTGVVVLPDCHVRWRRHLRFPTSLIWWIPSSSIDSG